MEPAVQKARSSVNRYEKCGLDTRRVACGILLFLFLLAGGGCARDKGPQPQNLPKAEITIGELSIAVEIANTLAQRTTGMMYRRKLGPDEGMLFIFERDENLRFFMKNTYVPLSIAFIRSDGIISNIADMEPHTLTPHHSRTPSRYALEMPQGWFMKRGFKAGTRVEIPPELAAAGKFD